MPTTTSPLTTPRSGFVQQNVILFYYYYFGKECFTQKKIPRSGKARRWVRFIACRDTRYFSTGGLTYIPGVPQVTRHLYGGTCSYPQRRSIPVADHKPFPWSDRNDAYRDLTRPRPSPPERGSERGQSTIIDSLRQMGELSEWRGKSESSSRARCTM
jgi:hypothetical protein